MRKTFPKRLEAVLLNWIGAVILLKMTLSASAFPEKPEWSIDFGGEAVGLTHLGRIEAARGVLISLRSGQVVVVNASGEKRETMKLDLSLETPAVAADLQDRGKLSLIAVDSIGSIYCFNEKRERQWKFPRSVKSGEFRLPVMADLDGDNQREIIVADSRGCIQALDWKGRLKLEIFATPYRVSVPAAGDLDGDGKAELIFGTDAGEVYCVDGEGALLWATGLDGCFGRCMPLVADADQDGRYEVYFPIAFNNPNPGLFALDAANGKFLWKAPSVMQSYRSTVVVDLNGDGRNEILFGDKNSSLFCLDSSGRQLWRTQLAGRGIYFAPAVAALEGVEQATSFVIVRDSGNNGQSLYAVDQTGNVRGSMPLTGGGTFSPVLCRFAGKSSLSLLTLSAGGRLDCYDLEKRGSSSRILWPGLRNDEFNSGFVKSQKPMASKKTRTPVIDRPTASEWPAFCGSNKLPIAINTNEEELVSIRTVRPDKSIHLDLLHAQPVQPTVQISLPGNYDVTVERFAIGQSTGLQRKKIDRFVYHLQEDFKEDAAQVERALKSLRTYREPTNHLSDLAAHFHETITNLFGRARGARDPGLFDLLRRECDYHLNLLQYCSRNGFSSGTMLHQFSNPWSNFEKTEWMSALNSSNSAEPPSPNTIKVRMLGNEYHSAAFALTNLRPKPAVYRITCKPFESGTNRVNADKVLSVHEVISIRPDGTGERVEDPLPLLGEAQTVTMDAEETRKLWLTFHSAELHPGIWRSSLNIANIAVSGATNEVPLNIEVYPLRLPERFTYRECNWLYLDHIQDEKEREATLRDALEHGMNVFVVPGVSITVDEKGQLKQTNTVAHDKLVQRLRGRAFFLVTGPVAIQWPQQARPSTELEEKTFGEALHWYAAHMRKLGNDYDNYAIYLQDEPGLLGRDAAFDGFVAQVKKFKAADPRMQLYANPAGGARAELLRPLANLIDVWAPDLHLVREQPRELSELFQEAKHYWHYEAPADQRTLDPLGFYRMKPWVAFQMGMTGGGYWVYSGSDFWAASQTGGTEYGSVYPTSKGPVTTKRWEASREGIQDYELLRIVRQTAKSADSPVREQAKQLIDEAVKFVTQGQEKVTDISRHVRPYTPDYKRWMEYRRSLIEMQIKLIAETSSE